MSSGLHDGKSNIQSKLKVLLEVYNLWFEWLKHQGDYFFLPQRVLAAFMAIALRFFSG